MKENLGAGLRKQGSPYSDTECDDIIRKLEAMLDGDQDVTQDKDFMEKVNNCEYCLEQYEIEKSFKELVKAKLKGLVVSNSLIQSIKSKLSLHRD
jgi:anti-sigma factor (TIGR02949 family)